ncbi:MAG: 50S ribosomal protein L12 [Candidatus Nanohaloarchaea archaeon]|nr:50S ribosomal protein L12 [Candidatus Nanohaloarchaea archaeon]
MELVYAALLLHESGKEVSEENLESVLEGAGIEVDSSQVKAAAAALEDVDLEDAMNQAVATGAAPAPSTGGEEQEEAGEEAEEGEEEPAEEEQADEEAEEAAEEGLGELF